MPPLCVPPWHNGPKPALREEPRPDHRPVPCFIGGHPDVVRTDGRDLQDALEEAYARHGDEEVCLVCRSNKRAWQYSQQVRARIHGFEEELEANDRLMVVKNNYFWAAQEPAGTAPASALIANGEQVTVRRVHRTEERYGLRFADVSLAWWDGREDRDLEVKLILDVLAGEGPALPAPRMRPIGAGGACGDRCPHQGRPFPRIPQ
jgi:exodeoxyribonuclease-5